MQEDYFANRQVTTDNNIGYFVLPKGYFTYRSRSDSNLFVFNRNNLINKGIISYYYPVFSSGKSDSNFLLRRLNYGIEDQLTMAAEGTGQRVLNHSSFKKVETHFPSNNEQIKIGLLFEKVDNLITLHQRKYSKELQTWEQRKLGDIGDTFTGLSGKTKEDFGHGNAKFVTYMNVFSNPISNINQVESVEVDYKQNEIKYGDIFFTTSSETPEEVGMSSVWLDNKENNYLNSFCFGFRQFVKNDPYYMGYMLRNPMVRKNITFLAQGISRYNISKNQMMNIEIPITNMEEQKLIGIFFKEIDNLITLHQHQ